MKRVLIVDRDPAVRALVAATIDANRYLLFEADAVRAGHEQFSECWPDVVILQSDMRSDWWGETATTAAVDLDRLEKTPVVLLEDVQATYRAPQPLPAEGTPIRAPFSPLRLIRRLEMIAGEPREAR